MELLKSKQTTLNRIRQTGSADGQQQSQVESEIAQISSDLEIHREQARKSHDYYKDVTSHCIEDWEAICVLESKEYRNENENQALENLYHNFTAVISADY